jgi:hypothetical protein
MVPCITAVLTRLKTDWATQLQPDASMAACQEAGYTSWRDRVLTPVTTLQLFLLQILHGNTACSHLLHLSGLRFSASAYCQARSKLPLDLFRLLLTHLCMESKGVDARWQAIQQLVVELLAPYHSRLQPMELAWPATSPASHEQRLWLTRQQEPEPRIMIPFTQSQFNTAVSPHDAESYARLREYSWGKVRPLIH